MNFREVRGAYGGANAFLRGLRKALGELGVTVTNEPDGRFDVALVNALTLDIDRTFLERLAGRGRPIVHRKVGYRVSGTPDMRREVDGVVHGDRLQIELSPFVSHTIFQSAYSRDVFTRSGFTGPHTVIHNGADEDVFNLTLRPRLRRPRQRTFWRGDRPFRLVISTWSTDPNKGFPEYERIDATLAGRSDVTVTLVGRSPVRFRNIRVLRARGPRRLAETLKRFDGLLQLARLETCSNALIEGINCGLPAVYLDSGSNAEVAGPYGVAYEGDVHAAVERLRPAYADIVARIPHNPFRLRPVAERYRALLEEVAS
jgi:hypothetical protein